MGMAKLTPKQVADIRARVTAGEMRRDVAKEYGVSAEHVSLIVAGLRRKERGA